MQQDEKTIVVMDKAGEEVPGPILRPAAYMAAAAVDLLNGEPGVGLVLYPGGIEPNFEEKITIMVALEDVDRVIKILRAAKDGRPKISNSTN